MKTKTHDKHKHKKHKKEKHKDKSKKKRKESTSESESESDEEELEWIESVHQKKSMRDDWMNNESGSFEDFIPTYSRDECGGERKRQRIQKAAAEKLLEQKLLQERELNPYMKNSESGLRMMRPSEDGNVKSSNTTVGDGGYSWLKKAYERVREQAATEGRTMEEVAVERWGSLEKLEKMLNDAKQQNRDKERSRSPSPRYDKKYDKYKSSQRSHHYDRHHSPSPSSGKKSKYDDSYSSRNHRDSYKKSSRESPYNERLHRHSDSRSNKPFLPPSDDHWPSWKKRKDDNYEDKPSSSHKYESHDRSSFSSHPSWKKKKDDNYEDKPSSSHKYESYDSNSSSSSHPSWKKKNDNYEVKPSSSHKYESYDSSSSSSSQPSWKKKDYRKDSISEKCAFEKDSDLNEKVSGDKTVSSSSRSSHPPAWKKKNLHSDSVSLQNRFAKESEDKDQNQESVSCVASECPSEEVEKKQDNKVQEVIDVNIDDDDSDDSDAEIKEKKDAMKNVIMNRNELNLLAARSLRAEFCADFQLAEEIQTALDAAKAARENLEKLDATLDAGQPREEVVDYLIDSYPLPKSLQKSYHGKRIKKTQIVQVGPFRKQYFDDKLSLKEMFQREKATTIDDQLKMYVDTAAACKNSVDEDFADDVSGKVIKKMDSYQQKEEKDVKKAIQDYKRQSSALEKCRYCLDKPLLPKHTIVAKGNHVIICVPPYTSLTEGHCLIIPKPHVSSSLHLEENEFNELQIFKRGLTKMFGDENLDIIFTETSVHQRHFPHTTIECIPVPKETADMAPMYFKKAIDECEMEWSQNKKLIDLSKKGFRHSVPKGLPFFSVEFSFGGGFAHIIEDEKNFPKHFGKEIIGGMLEIDSHLILKAKNEPLQELYKKTLKLIDKWWNYKKFFES